MQELIEDLKIFLPPSAYAVLNNFESHLEKEKQMVVDAFNDGYSECENYSQDRTTNADKYYNEKFSK